MTVGAIPIGWEATEIGDLAQIVTGSTPPTKHPEFFGGPYPFLKPGDLDRRVPITTAEESVSQAGAAVSRILPVGAVPVSCIGNFSNLSIADKKAERGSVVE